MTEVIVGAASACMGFAVGLLYAVRRLPRWLADMTEAQLSRLLDRAERARS